MAPVQAKRKAGLRQGGRKPDVYRIGGVDVPWDPDLDVDKPKPTPLFPPYKVHKPNSLSEKERRQISHLRSLGESIHGGPLYIILGENERGPNGGGAAAAAFNSFNGMQKYSQRYIAQKSSCSEPKKGSHVLRLFPRELWPVIDPAYKDSGRSVNVGNKSRNMRRLRDEGMDNQRLKGDYSDEEGRAENEDEVSEEEMDDDFGEEDEGGDYNAEQYFDDGGEDMGDDFEGADEGGVDYF